MKKTVPKTTISSSYQRSLERKAKELDEDKYAEDVKKVADDDDDDEENLLSEPSIDVQPTEEVARAPIDERERKFEEEAANSVFVDYTADNLSKKLAPCLDISCRAETEVFCVKWSLDSQYLAAGCGDGVIRVYNAKGSLSYNLNYGNTANLPITCIRFRPPSASSKTKNVLISASADGSIQHWHLTSQRQLYRIEEEDNHVYALDFRNDGEVFATAGKDCKVRIYEESTKTLLRAMAGGTIKATPGHSNRVFCVKFKENDPNLLISGGWDNTIQFWDMRVGHSVRSIYGPHICGDALDINSRDQILAGAWKPDHALQLYDFGSGRLLHEIRWQSGLVDNSSYSTENAMLYSAQFSPDGTLIAAGGTGTKDARIFDTTNNYNMLGRVRLGLKGIYSVDFAPNGRKIAIGGGTDTIAVRELQDNNGR